MRSCNPVVLYKSQWCSGRCCAGCNWLVIDDYFLLYYSLILAWKFYVLCSLTFIMYECSTCHKRFRKNTMVCPYCGTHFTGRIENTEEWDEEEDEQEAWDEEDGI